MSHLKIQPERPFHMCVLSWQLKPKYLFRCIIIFGLLYFASNFAIAKEEPPKLGNFALPTSQQPGPLLSFGQTNIGKGQTQVFVLPNNTKGKNQNYFSVFPAVLYGFNDRLTGLLGLPIAVSFTANGSHSSGVQDAIAGLEYIFYNKTNYCFADQATVFSYINFPTGSDKKNPVTGYGSSSIYIGGTLNRAYVDWYLFNSNSVLLTTMKNGTKFGNQYFYQFGLGRVIASSKNWIFSWLLEINGNFLEKDRREGFIDPNSGGNIVWAVPSLWFSNKKFIFQLGVGAPVLQKLNGEQNKNLYLVAGSISYTIS